MTGVQTGALPIYPVLESMVSPRLLSEIGCVCDGSCRTCDQACPVRVLARIRALSRALGEKRPTTPFASLASLERGYRELSGRVRERDWRTTALAAAGSAARGLPPPPFPGDASIVPIRTEAELYAEGLEMKNCLPRYRFEARAGRACFYRVLSPVRATLMVERSDSDGREQWSPGEIRGAENRNLPAMYAERCFRRLFETATRGEWLPEWQGRYTYTQAELPWESSLEDRRNDPSD